MNSLMVLIGWFLDVLSLKGLSDSIFTRFATPDSGDYPVHRAVWGLLAEGELDRAFELAGGRWERSKSPRAGRDLSCAAARPCFEAEQVAADSLSATLITLGS